MVRSKIVPGSSCTLVRIDVYFVGCQVLNQITDLRFMISEVPTFGWRTLLCANDHTARGTAEILYGQRKDYELTLIPVNLG